MDNQQSFGMEFRSVKEASVEGVQRRTKPKKHFVSFTLFVSCNWSNFEYLRLTGNNSWCFKIRCNRRINRLPKVKRIPWLSIDLRSTKLVSRDYSVNSFQVLTRLLYPLVVFTSPFDPNLKKIVEFKLETERLFKMLFQRRKTRLGSLQGTSFFPQENAMKLLRQLSQILTREKERKSGFCLLEIQL